MVNNNFLDVSNLDFDTLLQDLKNFLKSQDKYKDYNFEGSNFAVLLDVLGLDASKYGYYLNMVGSEMFMDTAEIKQSVISHAKELNYLPRSRKSSKATVTFTITPNDNPGFITIPKNYAISTQIDGTSYLFMTDKDISVTNNGVSYTSGNVDVYEGQLVTEFFEYQANSQYVLRSENVDVSSIEVTVSDPNGLNPVPYLLATKLINVAANSAAFFLEGYADNQYEISFGNGTFGLMPAASSLIKVVYRDTVGEDGNGAYSFNKTKSIQGYNAITITTISTSSEGAERESKESIQFNAPKSFTIQDRAVIAEDFEQLIRQNFPEVQAVSAYGGEDASPKQYGKVIISVKPFGAFPNAPQQLKDRIIAFLETKTLTTTPVIVDAQFVYLAFTSLVNYDPNATTLSKEDIISNTRSLLANVNNTTLTNFGSDLRLSKVMAAIDDQDPSIISNDTEVRMLYRWSPVRGITQAASFSYMNPVKIDVPMFAYPDGHPLSISSTFFTYTKNGVDLQNCYIGDNGTGTLRVLRNPDPSTIETVEENIGTVDYPTGNVQFNLNVRDYQNYISIIALPAKKDIMASKNLFLQVDPNFISVDTVSETE